MSLKEEMNAYILREIRPRIQATPEIRDVIVWVREFHEPTGTLVLGLALGQGTGCSPFCGCAAKQLAELIGAEMRDAFPQIRRTLGVAELPTEEILHAWRTPTPS